MSRVQAEHGGARRFVLALAALVVLLAIAVPSARAAIGDELLTGFGETGAGAGELNLPRAVATDPKTGQIFVFNEGNERIDEFTPWGEFVKAFGWNVAPGAVNEQQEVRVRAAAGQFRLGFGAQTTANLPFDAGAAEVQAALDGLGTISAGGGSVTVKRSAGNPDGTTPYIYVVSFTGGPLQHSDVEALGAETGATPLSGGQPGTELEVRTRADGTPGGSGLEACTTESGCQAGSEGTGAGQLDAPYSIAVGADGDIYIREASQANQRVQKFTPAGRFALMFGGEVDKSTGEDVCTAASGDECGAGVAGTGPGEFSGGVGLAIGPGGTIYVADVGRVQEFDPEGTYEGEVAVPGETVFRLAVDPVSGDLYVTYQSGGSPPYKDNAHKLSPTGSEVCTLTVARPRLLAADPSGSVYVLEAHYEHEPETVREFDASCGEEAGQAFVPKGEFVTDIATNTAGDLLLSSRNPESVENEVRIYGPPPIDFESAPALAPTITTQFASRATATTATVGAKVNPHFWPDATYHLEYGAGKCSEGGCPNTAPASGDLALGGGVVNRAIAIKAIELEGLLPATTYHYRLVSQSGGGGPAYGPDSTFKTFPEPSPPEADCPNQAFRTSFSAALPDCRAYEMVSPLDKENGDILAPIDITGFETRLNQSSADGDSLTYSSYRAFADPEAAPYISQYLARRGSEGWSSESLEAQRNASYYAIGFSAENPFKAFSADLCEAWVVRDSGPVVAAGAIEGFPNLYRRGNCPASYEALSTVEPPKVEAQQYFPEPQGFSADGSKAIFRVNDNLTPAAPAQPPSCEAEGKGCHYRTYEASGGTLSLLCILPDGTPFAGDCSAGSPPTFHKNRTAGVSHAISADGSVVYWSATEPDPDHPETTNPATEPGRIYARLNGSSTVKVSETQTTKPARFWGAAADGSKALFEVEDPAESPTAKNKNLYLYDLGEEASALIATKVIGVAAQSEDLSRIYYVSEAASEEEEEEGALPGRPNLYLWEAGTGESGFIATLSARDAIGTERYSDVTPEAVFHAAQATPDGSRLAFISVNPLTGFDNTDAQSGEADSEVFSYDAETKALSCASCSPVGVSPVGRIIEAPGSGGRLPTAASLPVGENQLYTPRALSADANHLLFTSYTDLLPTDTNAKADVYEWEAAGTEPGCESEADPDYYAANGGCLHLISSGSSEEDSELVDSSPSGKDVFLSTEQSLLPQDPGLIDIYDAREGGGFPARAAAPTPCAGEACQGQASPPPAFQGPASSTPGPGNPPAHKKPPRCPKGKHRVSKNGKSSCAKDKSHEKQRQAKHERKGRG